MSPHPTNVADSVSVRATATPPSGARLVSLDALRGFDMLWIIGGDVVGHAFEHLDGGPISRFLAGQFGHSEWAGLTFYDLIFPLFIFMVGVSITLSLDRTVERSGRGGALRRIARRSALLFLLGLLFYGGIAKGLEHLRLLGVLQRIAICYAVSALLFLYVKPRAIVAITAVLLLGYWALLTFVAVPGFGGGDYSRAHNLAAWVDQHYLPFKRWYGDYDPEGLLSTLPAIGSCLLGVIAGRILRDPARSSARKVTALAALGAGLLVLGYAWGFEFPIIKRIWTSSFALAAAGWSCLLLAAFYFVIDVRGRRRWAQPLVWVGMNAITIYLISHLVDFTDLSARLLGGEISDALDAAWSGLGGLVRAFTGIALCVALCGFLYRQKLFLRL